MTQSITFPYKFPYIPSEGDLVGRQVVDLNGGRDRTRTCDLLRVKHMVWRVFAKSLTTKGVRI